MQPRMILFIVLFGDGTSDSSEPVKLDAPVTHMPDVELSHDLVPGPVFRIRQKVALGSIAVDKPGLSPKM
jgi:hypothetical protein